MRDYKKEKATKQHGSIKRVAEQYGIKYQTLRSRIENWMREAGDDVDEEKRGGWNKWMTEQEERDLFLFIKDVFIDSGLPFNNGDLKLLAIDKMRAFGPYSL